MITEEVFSFYNTNDDMAINPEDDIEEDHYLIMVEYCDSNMDGSVNHCEIFDCVMVVENEWRQENCPEFGLLYCNNPYEPCTGCEGEWDCLDIYNITEEFFMAFDTNGDG